MSTKKKLPTVKPQPNATNKAVATVLDAEAVKNLTGYFDVLIQMDFAQKQRNERKKDGTLQNNSKNTSDTN